MVPKFRGQRGPIATWILIPEPEETSAAAVPRDPFLGPGTLPHETFLGQGRSRPV